MKLDKLVFGKLVKYIADLRPEHFFDVSELDELIDIDVPMPTVQHVLPNPAALESLMKAIHEGKKIEAIKSYRELTPDRPGLKEAKDTVEKDWKQRYSKAELLTRLGQDVGNNVYSSYESAVIKNFLDTLIS